MAFLSCVCLLFPVLCCLDTLVYLFSLNCPVTCCLDPFFHFQKFFHLIPLFSHSRPGLSLWQVPPISLLYLPHIFLSPFYRPGLSLWQVPPISFSLSLIGPACHCGRSRLSPSSIFSTFLPLSLSLIGPACHCGRSRLFFPPLFLPHPPRPFLSLSSIGPACHCGRSRQFLISPLLSKIFPPSPLPFLIL